ncbi:FAD/NAD(P)-binding domain-containing protein [Meredithblackwellia eburnea MCA 4105]
MEHETASERTFRKIAVVGSGVSGIAATWALNEHAGPNQDVEVHLFEADDRPGGHTNTVKFTAPGHENSKQSVNVDTGFIVFNTVTYPNLLNFFKTLKVEYMDSEMSFSVSRDRGAFEWAGTSLGALFAQKRNLFDPGMWRMVWDIVRFNDAAIDYLRKGDQTETIGQFLNREGYSYAFRDNYLLPMTAAIWSTPPGTAAFDFPALTLLRFMHNHHLLQLINRPVWLTLKNGSSSYVKRVLSRLPASQLHLSTRINSVDTESKPGKVILATEDNVQVWDDFDHVVFATHADTSLRIIYAGKGMTIEEKVILAGFQFGKNRAVLHSDTDLMPKLRPAWASWNYLTAAGTTGGTSNVNQVALTYWMNLLQSIPERVHGPVLVTLNPPFEPKEELTVGAWDYDHPQFTTKAIRAQELLPHIQNKRRLTFCGAWTKYGFHEDGFTSGLNIATKILGAEPPFAIASAERDLPAPTPRLSTVIHTIEKIREWSESPWEWFMVIMGFWLGFVNNTLWLLTGLFDKGSIVERLQEDVQVVANSWERSSKTVYKYDSRKQELGYVPMEKYSR